MSFKRNELIAASEVARYVYCKRAWSYDTRVRTGKHKKRLPVSRAFLGVLLVVLLGLSVVIVNLL